VVGKDVDSAGQMHEQQPTDDGVERFFVEERARVTLVEDDITHAGFGEALLRSGELRGISLDAHHGSVGPDHLGNLEGDVARAGTEVEDPHSRADATALQQKSRRLGEEFGLRLQPGDLGVVAAQDVFRSVHAS
jgi:hypothetical protein